MRRLTALCAAAAVTAFVVTSCGVSEVIVNTGGQADTLAITVVDANSIVVEDLTLEVGDTASLSATALNALGLTIGEVTPEWSSSAPSVATVSGTGEVIAHSAGTTQISAYLGDLTATVNVTVTAPPAPPPPPPQNQAPTAIITSPSQNITVTLGNPVNFQGSANDSDGAVVSHAWTFGDGGTASVEDPGNRIYQSAGTYNVTYRVTDDDGAQSTLATRTITVSDPSGPPPSDELLWASNWASGEWSDGGKWDDQSSWVTSGLPNRGALVIQDPTAPTQYVLSVVVSNDANSWIQMAPSNPPTPPAVGQSITWRWYQNITLPNNQNSDDDTHGIGWGAVTSPTNFALMYNFTTSNGRYDPQIVLNDGRSRYALTDSRPNYAYPLSKNTWYRFEITLHRQATSTWSVDYAIYDMAGTRLVETDDFVSWPLGGASNLANATWTGSAAASVDFTGFLNGIAGLSQQVEFGRFAAVAAVLGESVGPYDPARGW